MVKYIENKTKVMELDIKNIPFFASLTKEQQDKLNSLIGEVVLYEGELLFKKGDIGNQMYFIKSGKIRIFDTKENFTNKIAQVLKLQDKEQEINILGVGEFFGEMALISKEPRIFSAKAVENTVLYSLGRSALSELLNSNLESERLIAETFVQRVSQNN